MWKKVSQKWWRCINYWKYLLKMIYSKVESCQIKITDVFIQDQMSFALSAMCRTIKLLRKSMIYQEYLMAKIEQWKTEDSSQTFIFVQNVWMRNYLSKKRKSISKIVMMKMTKSTSDWKVNWFYLSSEIGVVWLVLIFMIDLQI